MAVEDDDFGRAEVVRAGQLGRDFTTEGGVGGEQSERDQAVRLAAAHRLGEVERAVLALSGKPLEAALDQKL